MFSTETLEFFENKVRTSKGRLKRDERCHDKIGAENLRKKIRFYQQAIDALVKVGTEGK